MATVPAPDDGADRDEATGQDDGVGRDDVTGVAQPDPAPPSLSAWIERNNDGPDMYTAAPGDATGVDLMSHWLTVPADFVCELAEMR